jgi:DnaD/phage-associated family protein
MQNGVCQATLEKIAERTGVGRQTVIEHIQILEKAGYIEDTTPDLRNRPHTYRDTGKAGLHIGVSTVRQTDSETTPTVRQTDSAVRQTDSHSTPSVLEDSIKIGYKIDSTTTREKFGEVFTAYQNEIGMLDGHVRDCIGDYLDDLHVPPDWIIEAIHIAAEQNKRNWAYCAAILKRWAVEGKTSLPKQTPRGSKYGKQSPEERQAQTMENIRKGLNLPEASNGN